MVYFHSISNRLILLSAAAYSITLVSSPCVGRGDAVGSATAAPPGHPAEHRQRGLRRRVHRGAPMVHQALQGTPGVVAGERGAGRDLHDTSL